MFQIGDYVECIDDAPHRWLGHAFLVKGTVYKIIFVNGFLDEIKLEGDSSFWLKTRFQLATPFPVEPIEEPKDIDYFSITKDIIGG